MPGARFELDAQAGRYRISKILHGDNSENVYRSPLTEVGVNASVGDYVLAIDGEELKANDDPYRLLRNKGDNPVQHNDPQSVIAGKDPQLERAIAEVMAKLKSPVKLPPKPAPPVKTIDRRQTSKATEQGNK